MVYDICIALWSQQKKSTKNLKLYTFTTFANYSM